MRGSLAFVAKGLAESSSVPAFRHLIIRGGRVQACNGWVTYCAPIALDLDVVVHGKSLLDTVAACTEAPRFTPAPDRQRLTVESGTLRVDLPCLAESVPMVAPGGPRVELTHDIRPSLRALLPFISEDPAKAWARGIKITSGAAVATNNVTLIEAYFPIALSESAVMSKHLVSAALRVKAAPVAMLTAKATTALVYASGAWIMARNYSEEWPNVAKLFPASELPPVDPGFFPALELLAKVRGTSDDLALDGDTASITTDDGAQARVYLPGCSYAPSCWSLQQLLSLKGYATQLDLSHYPRPAQFAGPGIRGAMAGKDDV